MSEYALFKDGKQISLPQTNLYVVWKIAEQMMLIHEPEKGFRCLKNGYQFGKLKHDKKIK